MTQQISNKLISEIKVGDQAQIKWHVSVREAQLFNIQSPMDDPYTEASNTFGSSSLIKALVSRLFTTELPGPGSELHHDDLNYYLPLSLHDDLVITIKVIDKKESDQLLTFTVTCHDQHKNLICDGDIIIKTNQHKITRPQPDRPEIVLFNTGFKFKKLMQQAEQIADAPRVAVVHPMNAETLAAAITAAQANLIMPIIIAPLAKLQAIATSANIDLTPYRCIDVPHSHAAAKQAVALAHDGEVDALMKGSLHTDELMHEVVDPTTGLRTDKRISHCFVMDIPTYPLLLTITDAAININPDLLDKRDILQNAINLLHSLGNEKPKAAILAAVETVSPKMCTTIDAAALCKMADRGQITGALVDGPLAFDNAISSSAAKIKGIESPVAGAADILLVPDLDAGNMLVKQLSFLTGAVGAGIVLGAKVPIILTSRADAPLAREASCALVKYYIHHMKIS